MRRVVVINRWKISCLITCCILSIVGCRRKPSLVDPSSIVPVETIAIPVHSVASELVDVSLPLGAVVKEFNHLHDCMMVVCECSQPLQDIADFYMRDNEQLGWRVMSQCTTERHASLVCEKPRRICVISMRTDYGRSVVDIHISNRIMPLE